MAINVSHFIETGLVGQCKSQQKRSNRDLIGNRIILLHEDYFEVKITLSPINTPPLGIINSAMARGFVFISVFD